MSQVLRGGITRLDVMTKFTLATLALASGVYTYIGVRSLLEGSPIEVFLAAIVYSAAVSVAIFAFWTYLMRFLPHVRQASSRRLMYVAMFIGSLMILAMSAWLNAAALAGAAALQQHMANSTDQFQQSLDRAHGNALAAQGLLPDIQLASRRFAILSDQERQSGALTGTSGSGTVVQLTAQMSAQLNALAGEVDASRDRIKTLFESGSKTLERMRQLTSGAGPIDERTNEFAAETVVLTGIIADLQQTSIAPAVKRTAEDLSKSFIAPAADGRTANLAERQNQVVGKVEQSIKAQSQALAMAADDILSRPEVKPVRFVPLSTAEAVIQYGTDFLPSWAGAISLDLMPAVLIFIHSIVFEAIRRDEGDARDEDGMSAGEVMRALKIYNNMQALETRPLSSQPHVVLEKSASVEAPAPGVEKPPGNVASINPAAGFNR
ncbi:hypothetical protein [Hyphomicrobium facile]|uniref:Uncharacterized protein n=1 Tax=Hyphomicrobium facile TaxID=51670 RepID=A0A1I7MUL0_9HYPH|nr:hypothetical protein [Hyphomicrobium facile]SFV26067.1 hypothetical protein SAMN04488557_0311 [Hyphomicrobium facile]